MYKFAAIVALYVIEKQIYRRAARNLMAKHDVIAEAEQITLEASQRV